MIMIIALIIIIIIIPVILRSHFGTRPCALTLRLRSRPLAPLCMASHCGWLPRRRACPGARKADVVQQILADASDAMAILAKFHRGALSSLAAHSSVPITTVHEGINLCKASLSNTVRNQVLKVDNAYKFARHLTSVFTDGLLADLQGQLEGLDAYPPSLPHGLATEKGCANGAKLNPEVTGLSDGLAGAFSAVVALENRVDEISSVSIHELKDDFANLFAAVNLQAQASVNVVLGAQADLQTLHSKLGSPPVDASKHGASETPTATRTTMGLPSPVLGKEGSAGSPPFTAGPPGGQLSLLESWSRAKGRREEEERQMMVTAPFVVIQDAVRPGLLLGEAEVLRRALGDSIGQNIMDEVVGHLVSLLAMKDQAQQIQYMLRVDSAMHVHIAAGITALTARRDAMIALREDAGVALLAQAGGAGARTRRRPFFKWTPTSVNICASILILWIDMFICCFAIRPPSLQCRFDVASLQGDRKPPR